jgi:hypothetical protein
MHEISRRLDEVVTRLESLSGHLEKTYVRLDLFQATRQLSDTERQQMDVRLSKLESRQEWLVRTVGGIIIAAVLGAVIATTKLTGGG